MQVSIQRLKLLDQAVAYRLYGILGRNGTRGSGAHDAVVVIGNKSEVNPVAARG